MTSPRLRKRRSSVASKKEALITFARVTVVVVALLLVCGVGLLERRQQSRQHVQQYPLLSQIHRNTLQETIVPIPIDASKIVDLWPDDSHKGAGRYRSSLRDCIPKSSSENQQNISNKNGSSSNPCQVRLIDDQQDSSNGHEESNQIQRVALVHPPGKLGDIFVEYVTRVLKLSLSPNDDNNRDEVAHSIELVSVSQLLESQQQTTRPYSKIIRMATLPILLDAADLFLAHAEAAEITANHDLAQNDNVSPTLQDVLDLVRQLARWQCHMSQHSDNTALLTITLDRMMGFSSMTTKRVQSFLGLTPASENPKQNRIAMDDITLIVTDIIDQASSAVQRILMEDSLTHLTAAGLNGRINAVIDEELTPRSKDAGRDGIAAAVCRPVSTMDENKGGLTNAIVAKMMA